ncbi:MAG TPA: type II toxin-antitoxin system death-on-curing family toxin [Myxococcota bacterium]|nr:type II toxin-antitoxin system death-on-curing family toxin [Myxococcota bacterium]
MIRLLESEQIITINKKICLHFKNIHHCVDPGRVESALHSAYFPGSPPFRYGGIPKVAGAMAFFIVKAHAFVDGNKRTGALASTMFMDLNGFSLKYAENPDAFYEIINGCAAGTVSKEKLIDWYDSHKFKYP